MIDIQDDAYIEVTCHYPDNDLMQPTVTYKWEGGNIAAFTKSLLEEADPAELEFNGDRVLIGPYRLRIIDEEPWSGTVYAVRENRWGTLYLWRYRLKRLVYRIYRRLIITAAVRGLADYNPAVVPTWHDVHLFQQIADWLERIKDERRVRESTNIRYD